MIATAYALVAIGALVALGFALRALEDRVARRFIETDEEPLWDDDDPEEAA